MVSLRGRAVVRLLKKRFNVNPEINKAQIESIQRLDNFTKFKLPKGYSHQKMKLNDLPIEVIQKENSKSKNAVYLLHGGAYIAKLNGLYRKKAVQFSKAGNADVVLIDYRVAPQNKYPSALEDALAGWDWLIKQGYNEDDIVVIGDSAGAHLTLSLILKLREQKRPLPKAAICISPWADMAGSGASYYDNYNVDALFGHKDKMTKEKIDKFMHCDIFSFCKGMDRYDPYISPVFAEYHDFPPMLITVGSHELLLSDSITIADKMKKENREVILDITPGMFHVFPLFDKLMPESKKAMKLICNYISKQFTN